MENTVQNETITTGRQKVILALIGFLLVLAGPVVLYGSQFLISALGRVPILLAQGIIGIAGLLPSAGAVLGIISLCFWKESSKLGRAFSIVTVILCNPAFAVFYMGLCFNSYYEIAAMVVGM